MEQEKDSSIDVQAISIWRYVKMIKKLSLGSVIILCGFLSGLCSFSYGLAKYTECKEKNDLENKIQTLKEDNRSLKNEIQTLKLQRSSTKTVENKQVGFAQTQTNNNYIEDSLEEDKRLLENEIQTLKSQINRLEEDKRSLENEIQTLKSQKNSTKTVENKQVGIGQP
jgi:chaperonin cofactor prefoldin